MNFNFALNLLANDPKPNGGGFGTIIYLVVMVAIFAVMYLLMIRPQKKKQKEEEKMRNNVQIGDEIITIGGFYGKIVAVKEDSFVIESVIDGSKQKICKTAMQTCLTIHDEI